MRDQLLPQLAADQHGVVSARQLTEIGFDKHAVARRVGSGRLHVVHRGVYAVGHEAITLHGRFLAAVLACGLGAVLSHLSAAELWELLDPEPRLVHVTAAVCPRHPGIKGHRVSVDPRDVTRRHGIPVMTPARTLLSLAETMPPEVLRRPLRRALAHRWVGIEGILDVVCRHRGHRGAARLAAVVAEGYVPTRSELEDVVFDLILSSELPRPEVNVRLDLDGRRVFPDFLWPARRLVVEADSKQWHDDPLARADDAERQALLEAHGYRVLRVTWAQAVAHPAQTLRRIAVGL